MQPSLGSFFLDSTTRDAPSWTPAQMWVLANKTPYAAERNWVRDKDGLHWWLVAVRATFVVDRLGKLVLADEQPPPTLVPEHHV